MTQRESTRLTVILTSNAMEYGPIKWTVQSKTGWMKSKRVNDNHVNDRKLTSMQVPYHRNWLCNFDEDEPHGIHYLNDNPCLFSGTSLSLVTCQYNTSANYMASSQSPYRPTVNCIIGRSIRCLVIYHQFKMWGEVLSACFIFWAFWVTACRPVTYRLFW